MDNKSVDFQKSKAMPRIEKDLVIAVVLALLPIILVAVLIVTGNGRSQESETNVPAASSSALEGPSYARDPAWLVELPGDSFDYEAAAELSAMRWREMARFYEKNGLLTRGAPQFNADLDRFTTAPNAEQARAYESVMAREAAEAQSNRYLTEPGWLQAREYEATRGQGGAAAVDKEYSFYTERYWNAAAESQSAQPVEGTERDNNTLLYRGRGR